MPEENPHGEDEDPRAPARLIEALNHLHNEPVFVPPTVNEAVLREAGRHLQEFKRPQLRREPWLSWAAMAACLALAAWLVQRFDERPGDGKFAREDINHDGRVDILDAFALAQQIEKGGTLDPRWDINGDGRIDRSDVNAIAARAVSLGQAVAADVRRLWKQPTSDSSQVGNNAHEPQGRPRCPQPAGRQRREDTAP